MRRFLAMAVFVGACLALVATSPEDDDFGREQYRLEGQLGAPSFALDADSPRRAFMVTVQVDPSEKVLSFSGDMEISATASWESSGRDEIDADSGAAVADAGSQEDAGADAEPEGPPIQLTVLEEGNEDIQGVAYQDALQFDHSSELSWDCKDEDVCEQRFRVSFERTDNGKQGGVQRINWAVSASLNVKTTIRKSEGDEEDDEEEDAGDLRPRLRIELEIL